MTKKMRMIYRGHRVLLQGKIVRNLAHMELGLQLKNRPKSQKCIGYRFQVVCVAAAFILCSLPGLALYQVREFPYISAEIF